MLCPGLARVWGCSYRSSTACPQGWHWWHWCIWVLKKGCGDTATVTNLPWAELPGAGRSRDSLLGEQDFLLRNYQGKSAFAQSSSPVGATVPVPLEREEQCVLAEGWEAGAGIGNSWEKLVLGYYRTGNRLFCSPPAAASSPAVEVRCCSEHSPTAKGEPPAWAESSLGFSLSLAPCGIPAFPVSSPGRCRLGLGVFPILPPLCSFPWLLFHVVPAEG